MTYEVPPTPLGGERYCSRERCGQARPLVLVLGRNLVHTSTLCSACASGRLPWRESLATERFQPETGGRSDTTTRPTAAGTIVTWCTRVPSGPGGAARS